MRRPKRDDRPILLNLPNQILEEIDMAVREQGVNRTHFLRQAVERNLRHYQNFERAIFARIYQKGMFLEDQAAASWDTDPTLF